MNLWRVAWRYVGEPPPGQAAAGHGEFIYHAAPAAQDVADWSNANVLPRGAIHHYIEKVPHEEQGE